VLFVKAVSLGLRKVIPSSVYYLFALGLWTAGHTLTWILPCAYAALLHLNSLPAPFFVVVPSLMSSFFLFVFLELFNFRPGGKIN